MSGLLAKGSASVGAALLVLTGCTPTPAPSPAPSVSKVVDYGALESAIETKITSGGLGLGTVDAVMVRDGEMGESAGRRGSGDLHRVGQAVEGRRCMAVKIDERASDRAPRIDIPAGADHDLDLLHQGLLEEVEVLERKSRAQRDAVE